LHGHRPKRGFTIVEVLVVLVVIAILTGIATYVYTGYQATSRNNSRSTQAHIIADSLEDYYNKNGEYPSVPSIVNQQGIASQPGSVVQNTLSLPDPKVLILPGSSSTTTNSLTQTDPSTTQLAYNGDSDDDEDKCTTDVNTGCDEFTLQWEDEGGNIKEIPSNHQGRTVASQTPPTAPNAPTVSITFTSPNIVATASAVSCDPGSSAEYKILGDSNTTGDDPNFADWSTVSWQSGRSVTKTAVQGTYYYYKAIAHCVNEAGASDDSDESDVATYFYATTGTPVVDATISGTTVTVTIAAVACPSGSTAKYQLWERKDTTSASGTYAVVSGMNFTTTRTYTGTAGGTSSPTKNSYKAYTRCDTGSTQGTASPASGVASVTSAPVAPTISNTTSGDNTTWSWSLPASACPVGTTINYHRVWTGDYINEGDGAVTTATSFTLQDTSQQGYQYGMHVQASCGTYLAGKILYGSFSSDSTYLRPVTSQIWVYKGSVRIKRPSSSSPNYVFGQGQATASRNTNSDVGLLGSGAYPSAANCASGLTRQIRWQWAYDNVGGSSFGYGSPTNGNWSPIENWADGISKTLPRGSSTSDYTAGEADLDGGDTYEIAFQTRCINPHTNRAGDWGRSDNFGNVYLTNGDGHYHTYCNAVDPVPWCQAWHARNSDPHTGRNDSDSATGTCSWWDEAHKSYCWTPIYSPNNYPWGWDAYSS